MNLSERIAACPHSNMMLAAGFSVGASSFGEQWTKEVAPNVWIVASDDGFGLGNGQFPLGAFIADDKREESHCLPIPTTNISRLLQWCKAAENRYLRKGQL